jgi:hypothetical protein
MGGSTAIDPYQQYIDYLEDVVIYNLKRELSEALASPDPLSRAGEDRCCKCSTYTLPQERLVPSTFTTSTPTGVLYDVTTLQRLYALWAVLVQLDSLGMLQ